MRAVEVLPDVSGIDRTFSYSVPAGLDDVPVGSIVRVLLHGRRVRGWVVAANTPPPGDLALRDIIQVVSMGPPPDVVDLCRWGAWRYAGRLRPLLAAASPTAIVRRLPAGGASGPPVVPAAVAGGEGSVAAAAAVAAAVAAGEAVVRLPPAAPRLPLVLDVLAATRDHEGDPMILVESHADALTLARRLVANRWPVAVYPDDWAAAAAGGRVVIGTRNVALSPGRRSVIVVLDAHSESYRAERVPAFDARVIVAERGRREGAPVVYVSPCPSVELVASRKLVTLDRSVERAGWPTVSVLDAREEDPHEGGYPSRLVSFVREAIANGAGPDRPVVLVLNRTGRARLLGCSLCRSIQRCERCGSALVQTERPAKGETGVLRCPRCEAESPAVCRSCGSARLRMLRPGVSGAREQLAALLGLEVAEMGKPGSAPPRAPVVVGTEAVLHALREAAMVGWLDLDGELLSPRFRAPEQALVLLARSARLVGGRGRGRLVLRTSVPDHEVVRAAQTGSPGLVADAEAGRRLILQLPPVTALAEVRGPGAAGIAVRLPDSVETMARGDGSYVVRAPDSTVLADAFASLLTGEPAGWAAIDARVEVDPLDL